MSVTTLASWIGMVILGAFAILVLTATIVLVVVTIRAVIEFYIKT